MTDAPTNAASMHRKPLDSLPPAFHATAVAVKGAGVVITGPPGSGKSDLALRLIDRGAVLIGDDYIVIRQIADQIILGQMPNIAGRLEMRGLGIIKLDSIASAPAILHVSLGAKAERLPSGLPQIPVGGFCLPTLMIDAFHHSAPIKIERALTLLLDPGGSLVTVSSAEKNHE